MAADPVSVCAEEEYVYRISTAEEWDSLQTNGRTLGGELDKTTGCIHLSKLNQVEWVLRNFYRGKEENLYLLQIEAKRLGEGLVYEAVDDESNNVFPHFYGPSRSLSPLALDAVTKAEKLIPDPDLQGKFTCSSLLG